jgi:hypothetical protein
MGRLNNPWKKLMERDSMSPQGMAYRLMEMIAGAEGQPLGNASREYVLRLAQQCVRASTGVALPSMSKGGSAQQD